MSGSRNLDEYQQSKKIIDDLIWVQKRLPEQVFKIPFQHFAFLEFEEVLYRPPFLDNLQKFLHLIDEEEFWFVVVSPDPEEFFFQHFRKYPVFRFRANGNKDEYFNIIEMSLSDDSKDSIELHSTVILLASTSNRWVIYADRDFEITIVGFATNQLKALFTEIYGKQKIFSIPEVVDEIFSSVYCHASPATLRHISTKFESNYSSVSDEESEII